MTDVIVMVTLLPVSHESMFIDELHDEELHEHGIKDVSEPEGNFSNGEKDLREVDTLIWLGNCIIYRDIRIGVNLTFFIPMLRTLIRAIKSRLMEITE